MKAIVYVLCFASFKLQQFFPVISSRLELEINYKVEELDSNAQSMIVSVREYYLL